MSRFIFHKIFAGLFWFFLCVGLLCFLSSHLLAGMSYSLVSERKSPNGKMIIQEFRSNQDGLGHAPYGQILTLSHGAKLKNPDDGYVFFAGYCKQLQYNWNDDKNVSIHCMGGDPENSHRTLASVMYGIKVIYSDGLMPRA